MDVYYYLPNASDEEFLHSIIQNHISLIKLKDGGQVPQGATMLLTESINGLSAILEIASKQQITILSWEKLWSVLNGTALDQYVRNERYMLQYSLERACMPETTQVIIGSSYAKKSIISGEIGCQCANLGGASQDIYYSFELLKMAVSKNPNIKQVVFVTGYFTAFADLSRVKSDSIWRSQIANVLYPVTGKLHHAVDVVPSALTLGAIDKYFIPEKVYYLLCKSFFDAQERGELRTETQFVRNSDGVWSTKANWVRKETSGAAPIDGVFWSQLPREVQALHGRVRASHDHNKLLSYQESYQENCTIFEDLVDFCNARNIQLYVICAPQTGCYMRHLDSRMIKGYFAMLDRPSGPYHFLDFHELSIFTDEDFSDSDHLNQQGAKKVSEFVKELLSDFMEQR